MKSLLKYTLLLLGSAALLLSGCELEQAPEWDEPAVLYARIEGADPGTKTSYDSEGPVGEFQWNEGDQIAVHFSNGSYVTGTVAASTGEMSVQLPSGATRDYYAVYPATAAVTDNYGNPTLQITYPASYDISDIVSGSSTTRTADFSPCPMVARNEPESDLLCFYHVGGLLRLTIKKENVPAATQQVRVTFDKDVTGIYTVSNPATAAPTVTTGGSASGNVVTFTLAPAGGSVGSLPENLVLNVPVPCGTYEGFTVECVDLSGAVTASEVCTRSLTLARHHGKKLTMKPNLYVLEGNLPASQSVIAAGGNVTFATNFLSYKQDGSAAAKEPFVFQYSATGADGSWTDGLPDWLSPATGTDLSGATTATTISFTASALSETTARSIYVRVLQTSSGKTTSACQITQSGLSYTLQGTMRAEEAPPTAGGTVTFTTNFLSYVNNGITTTKEPFVFQYSANGTSDWTDTPPDWLSPATGTDLSGATTATTLSFTANSAVPAKSSRSVYVRILQTNSGRTTSRCQIVQYDPVFSVSDTKTVRFAKSNLVVTYRSDGNHLWEFEQNAWDFSYGTEAGEYYAGKSHYQINNTRISHFGWGTGNTPWQTSPTATYDWSDWGKHFDAAGNGLHSRTNGTWYTLSLQEWNYVKRKCFMGRINVSDGKYVNGLVLIPDVFVLPAGGSLGGSGYEDPTYTPASWAAMEAAGAVFLPAAGINWPSSGINLRFYFKDLYGYYSTSTAAENDKSERFFFYSVGPTMQYPNLREIGLSVRLVHD